MAISAWAGVFGHHETQAPAGGKDERAGKKVPIDWVCHNEPDTEMLTELAVAFNEVRSIDRKLPAARGHLARDLAASRRKAVDMIAAAGESHYGSFGAQMCAARALELAPRETRALTLRGMAALRSGDRKQAAQDARTVLQEEPDNKGAADLCRLATGKEFKSGR
ncbi:MAG: hypothetical protein HZB91_06390 [Elusimicrobia bacterium]|nr:hypothetical protein [Elusimicrobiota bacterium]